MRDLLYLSSAPDVAGFTNDPQTGTKFDNNGDKLEVSQGLWGDYQTAAEDLAAKLVADPAQLAKVVPTGLPSDATAKARAFVAAFGERAYRRPLTAAELDSHLALFQRGAQLFAGSDAFTSGVQLLVQAMLQSPHFVYRVESGTSVGADGTVTLDDYEIASRLSYMLWDSMPDATLFAAAKAGVLHDSKVLAAQAKRMLADPKAATKLDGFHAQLLELARYDTLHPAGQPSTIGASMRQETQRFVDDVVVKHDGNLKTLLGASYSFVNKDLASLYGLSGTYDTTFVRAELDPKVRAGLLTQPGFLTYRSGGTAPILRGVFINLNFLCAKLPPPPVFKPPTMKGVTRRQRVDSITGKGTCGESCHARMINPAGFPLEYFDDVGRYRTQDSGQPVDGSASYSFSDGDQSYDGPIQWSQAMLQSVDSHACYVRHWLEFGFGRQAASGDEPLIARVAEASRMLGLPVKDLLVELVQSPSFQTRVQVKP